MNKQETYACAPSAVKRACAPFDLCASLVYFARAYDFGRGDAPNRPPYAELSPPLRSRASLLCARTDIGNFSPYATRSTTNHAVNFKRRILPQIVRWIERMRGRTETARLGAEHFLAAFDDGVFRVYTYRSPL